MAISRRKRFEILERDGFQCGYCGRPASESVLEVDHIVARSRGGTDDPSNLVSACFDCNRGKRDHDTYLIFPPVVDRALGELWVWSRMLTGDELPRTQPRRTSPIDWTIPRAEYPPLPIDEVMRLAEAFCGDETTE